MNLHITRMNSWKSDCSLRDNWWATILQGTKSTNMFLAIAAKTWTRVEHFEFIKLGPIAKLAFKWMILVEISTNVAFLDLQLDLTLVAFNVNLFVVYAESRVEFGLILLIFLELYLKILDTIMRS